MTFIFKHNNTSFELINYGTIKEPFFKGKRIATFLGYIDTTQAIRKHVWDANKTTLLGGVVLTPPNIQSLGFTRFQRNHVAFAKETMLRSQNTIYLNEAGMYQLIFHSKLPIAHHFQQWIFNDVLPSIRKTGQFAFNNHSVKPLLTFKIENEYDLHKLVVNFLKCQYPHVLLTIQNGELQNDTQEKRIKSFNTGYESGSFDIIINNLHKKYNGFALELKSPSGKGVVSSKQLDMQKKYELNGFKTLISNNYNDILFQIVEYMRETRLKCLHCSKKFKNTTTLNNHLKYFHKINI